MLRNLLLIWTVSVATMMVEPAPRPAPQWFAIMGNVRDNTGRALNGMRVSLVDDNQQPIGTVFTDISGKFQFRRVVSGVYHVRVETGATLYEELSERLDLQSATPRGGNEPVMLDLILKPKKGEAPKPTADVLFFQEVPPAARAEYDRAVGSLKKDRWDQAQASLKKGIEIFPDFYQALETLGSEQVRRGEFDAAIPVLTHALEINERAPKSLYALGVALLKLNHNSDAAEWLKKAAAQDGKNPNVYMMLGIAYGNQGMIEPAEASLRRAYELGGEQAADAHLYLAGIYNKRTNYTRAIAELELYLKEARDVKDPGRIRSMIESLRAKERAKN
jgi:TolA-binding protein